MPDLNISVDFYNETHKELFRNFPNFEQINTLVRNNLVVSKGEFLTYMMFTEQDNNEAGYRNYKELNDIYSCRIGDLDNFLTFNNGSVQSRVTPARMNDVRFTERLGVALGICAVNKIHGMTEADWKKIPEGAHPTFDFQIPMASTGINFIQAENKGCVVDDNSYKRTTVSQRFAEIEVKKEYVREQERLNGTVLHQNLYYGTIGVIDWKKHSN